jgi:hypothetical protein
MFPFVGRGRLRVAGYLAVAGAMSCGSASTVPDVASKTPGSSVSMGTAGSGPVARYQVMHQRVFDTSTGLFWAEWSEPGRYDWLLANAVCHKKGMRLPKAAELRALRQPELDGAVCQVDSSVFLGERCVTFGTQDGLAFSAMAGAAVPFTGSVAVRCVR